MLMECKIFRRYLVKTIMGITVFGFPELMTAGSLIPVNKKPNVIIILTDDQGYGDLSCHGNPFIKTPNLDKLYSESLRFTDFHVSPFCSPTRAQLLTGRYPSRTGVWHSVKGRSLIHRDEITSADIFMYNGYKTAIFGKWHLGDNFPFRPQDRGFDEVLIHGGGGIGNSGWGDRPGRRAARCGAAVIVNDLDTEEAQSAVSEIAESGGKAARGKGGGVWPHRSPRRSRRTPRCTCRRCLGTSPRSKRPCRARSPRRSRRCS